MTEWQVLRKVEIPVATPLILLGLRISAIQVVATATIAAYIGLGGLAGNYRWPGPGRVQRGSRGRRRHRPARARHPGALQLLRWLIVPVGLRRQTQTS